jgi:hypothetical protein
MARHAGFAAVASVTEGMVNSVLASYAESISPLLFPLPQTITVGPVAVSFAGLVEMDPPTVELHANPNNLIIVHLTFQSQFLAQATGIPQRRWKVRLSATVSTAVTTVISNNLVLAAVDLSHTTLQSLQVRQLAGPPLPDVVLGALQSPALAASATAFVNSMPQLTLSTPLVSSRISQSVPATFKETGVSLFEWYRIDLTASRVVLQVLEKALTAAVDFAGFSQGDVSQLVDLTRVSGVGSIYVSTITPDTDTSFPPLLVKQGETAGDQVAFALNMDVLSAIVARQVSPPIGGTPIARDIVLNGVSLGYATFEKPLRGKEDGLALYFDVRAKGVHVTGVAIMQAYLQTYDGPTNFIKDDTWRLLVGALNIDFPWELNFLIAIGEVYFFTHIFLFMFVALININGLFRIIDDLLRTVDDILAKLDPANLGVNAQQKLQGQAYSLGLPAPWLRPLPGLTQPNYNGMVRNVAFTHESVDVGLRLSAEPRLSSRPIAVFSTTDWPAYRRQPIPVTLKLRADWERLAASPIMLTWEVRRTDTNVVVATAVKRYDDPNGNGVSIPHHSEALYIVEAFDVRCSVTIALGNQTGEIWSGQQTIPIFDPIDRTRNYVRWGPHIVHFANAGTGNEVWAHVRTSRIHRTAVAARCKMLWLKVTGLQPGQKASLQYIDSLGFPLGEINDHRDVLCEYCFFGGPDKFTPFPAENFFEPHPAVIGMGHL